MSDTLYYFILKFIRLCGICPISFDFLHPSSDTITFKRNKLNKNILPELWTLFCLVSIILYTFFVLDHTTTIANATHIFDQYNQILKVSLLTVTHIVILIQSLLTTRYQRSIFKIIKSAKENYRKINIGNEKQWHRNFVWIFLIYELFSLLQQCATISFWTKRNGFFNLWTISMISFMISRTRSLFDILFIDMIANGLREINQELKHLTKEKFENVDLIFRQTGSMKSKDFFRKFKILINMYSQFYDISCNLNRMSGVPQAMNLLWIFFHVTCDSYWIYKNISKERMNPFGRQKPF